VRATITPLLKPADEDQPVAMAGIGEQARQVSLACQQVPNVTARIEAYVVIVEAEDPMDLLTAMRIAKRCLPDTPHWRNNSILFQL